MEPIRLVGEYKIPVHLTIDLIPEITVKVRREGEVARAEAVRTTKLNLLSLKLKKWKKRPLNLKPQRLNRPNL